MKFAHNLDPSALQGLEILVVFQGYWSGSFGDRGKPSNRLVA